jgi:hypothetical protein
MSTPVKKFTEWSAENSGDTTQQLTGYADYVRSSLYKAGEYDAEVEAGIEYGTRMRAKEFGLLAPDADDKTASEALAPILNRPDDNPDSDAEFVKSYLDLDRPEDLPDAAEKAELLRTYIARKQVYPESATELQDSVNELLADKALVRKARESAVDRNELKAVAYTNDKGERDVRLGFGTTEEDIRSSFDSLVASGALKTSDLPLVQRASARINGTAYNDLLIREEFNAVFADMLETDNSLGESFANAVEWRKSQETIANEDGGDKALRIGGNVVGGLVKVGAAALIAPKVLLKELDDAVTGGAIMGPVEDVVNKINPIVGNVSKGIEALARDEGGAPSESDAAYLKDMAKTNKLLRQRFSAEQIDQMVDDQLLRAARPTYRADKPETGLRFDSMGQPVLAPDAVVRDKSFDAVVAASNLNEEQLSLVKAVREEEFSDKVGDMKALIMANDTEGASLYNESKAKGVSDADFVRGYYNDDEKYSAMQNTMEGLGMATLNAVTQIPIAAASMAGSEGAAKLMLLAQKDDQDRRQYARVFGDEFGFGRDVLFMIPQLASDIGLALATGGTGVALRKGAVAIATKASMKNAMASFGRAAMSASSAAATKLVAAINGKAGLSGAIREMGEAAVRKLSGSGVFNASPAALTNMAPMLTVAFARSTSASYGSIYSQLPEDMSHEEKNRQAIPLAISTGLVTMAITGSFSAMGLGGTEVLSTGRIGAAAARAGAAARGAVPLSEMTFRQLYALTKSVSAQGKGITEKAFRTALRRQMVGTTMRFFRDFTKQGVSEGLEESLDQAFQIGLEDAAFKRNTPVAQLGAQVLTAGMMGAVAGAGANVLTQAKLSSTDRAAALRGRTEMLEKLAANMTKSGSPATASVLDKAIRDSRRAASSAATAAVAVTPDPATPSPAGVVPHQPNGRGPAVQMEFDMPDAKGAKRFRPLLNDLVDRKVTYKDMKGRLSLGANGNVLFTPAKPVAGIKAIDLGNRLQYAHKVNVGIKFQTLPVSPDGVPYMNVGKARFRFPAPVEGESAKQPVSVIRNKSGRAVAVVVAGATAEASNTDGPPPKTDVTITDPQMMRQALKYYGIDLEGDTDADADVANDAANDGDQQEFGFVDADGPVTIPFTRKQWNKKTKTSEPVTGSAEVLDVNGRMFVVRRINGVAVPFFLHTAPKPRTKAAIEAAKDGLQSGKWYPAAGIGADGWPNHTPEAANYYGSAELQAAAAELDATIGDVRKGAGISKAPMNSELIGFMNRELNGLNPVPATGIASDKLVSNISKLVASVAKPKPKPAAKPAVRPKAAGRGKKPTPAPAPRRAPTPVAPVLFSPKDSNGVYTGGGGTYKKEGFFEASTLPQPTIEEGWKPHVSATAENASRVLAVVLPILNRNRVPHKFVAVDVFTTRTKESNTYDKFVTMYPESPEAAAALMKEIDAALVDAGLTEARWKDNPENRWGASGMLSYRYGGFFERVITVNGKKETDDPNNNNQVPDTLKDLLGTAEQSGDTADGATTAVVAEKAEKLVASGLLTRAQASALMRAKDVQAALETKVASLLNGGLISNADAEEAVTGIVRKVLLQDLVNAGIITTNEANGFDRTVFRNRVLKKVRAAAEAGTLTKEEADAALNVLEQKAAVPVAEDTEAKADDAKAEATVPVAETDVVDSTIEGVIKSKSLMEVFEMASRIGDIEESEMSDLRDKLLGEDGVEFEADLDAAIDFLSAYAQAMPNEMAEMQSAILTRISAVGGLLNQVTGVEEDADVSPEDMLFAMTSPVEEDVVTPEMVKRHSELESKYNAGTITEAETAEASAIVEQAARAAGFVRNLYTAQNPDSLNGFDFRRVGQNERGMAALGPAIYLLDDKDMTQYVYGKRGPVHDILLSEDAFIIDILSRDQNHWREAIRRLDAAAVEAGYESYDSMPRTNVSGLRDGRGPVGTFVKLLGREKTRELFIKHGIHGSKEQLPSGAYEFGIYDPSRIKSADPFTGTPLNERFNPSSLDIRFAMTSPVEEDVVHLSKSARRKLWTAFAKKYLGLNLDPTDIPLVRNRYLRVSDFPEGLRNPLVVANVSRRLSQESDMAGNDIFDTLTTEYEDGQVDPTTGINSGTFDLDMAFRNRIRSDIQKRNGALAEIRERTKGVYSDSEIIEAVSGLPTTYEIEAEDDRYFATAGDIRFAMTADQLGVGITQQELARHSELEAKHDNGTITEAEVEEARSLVEKAAKAAGFALRGKHGTPRGGFTVFDTTGQRIKGGVKNVSGADPSAFIGSHFSIGEMSNKVAKDFADGLYQARRGARSPQVYDVFIKSNSPATLSAEELQDEILSQAVISDQFFHGEWWDANGREASGSNKDPFDLLGEGDFDAISDAYRQYMNDLRSDGFDLELDYLEVDAAKQLGESIRTSFKNLGLDSIVYENMAEGGEAVIVFNPDQIKSADPFTGTPLNERFNPSSPDIRNARTEADRTPLTAASDPMPLVRDALPAGMRVVEKPDMIGTMGFSDSTPDVIYVNPKLLAEALEGLSPENARYVVRTLTAHELGHKAAEMTNEQYNEYAAELGEAGLAKAADAYYSVAYPDPAKRARAIARDRANGRLSDTTLAAEAWRMQLERSVFGRTSELHLLFLQKNPNMMQRFLDSLSRFIARIKQYFSEKPSLGTAAAISQSQRAYRKLLNGGLTPETVAPDATMSHHAEMYAAITNGTEQASFEVRVASESMAEENRFMKWMRRKLDNFIDLPKDARDIFNDLNGTRSTIKNMSNRFIERYNELAERAIAAKLSPEVIRDATGDSSSPIDAKTLKGITDEVTAFAETLNPEEMTTYEFDTAVEKFRADKLRAARKAHNTAARAKSEAALQTMRDSGHPELAEAIENFRQEIDKYSERLGFTEGVGVYLTRTFQLFTTEGWTLAAKEGGLRTFNGVEYDFDAMRAAAAEAFHEQVLAEADKEGVTLTPEQLHEKVVDLLDGMLTYLESQSTDSSMQTAGSIKKDLDRYMPKGQLDSRLRALMGEIDDPLINMLITYRNVGTLSANTAFLEAMGNTLLESGIGSRVQTGKLVPAFGGRTNPELEPLNNIFVTEDVAKAIQAAVGYNGRFVLSNAQETVNEMINGFSRLVGFSVVMKTLPSVGFHTRNVFSNQVVLLASLGISPINKHTTNSYHLASLANFLNKRMTLEETAQVAELIELQVIADSSSRKMMQELLAGHSESDIAIVDQLITAAINGKTQDAESLTKKAISKFRLGYDRSIDFLQAINGVVDDAAKLQVFFHEMDILREAHKGRDPDLTPEQREFKLKQEAAKKVKNTMPTHSQQWDLIRATNQSIISKLVFPFARWKSEVIRTTIGNYRTGIEEIKSGNPVLARRGTRRLLWASATITVGSAVAAAAYGTLYGLIGSALAALGLKDEDERDDEETDRKLTLEERAAVRNALPLWQQAHQLFIRSVGDDLHIIDMSNIMPHNIFIDPFALIYEDIKTNGSPDVGSLVNYVKKSLIGSQIATGGVVEMLSNTDDYGRAIVVEGEPTHTQVYKLFSHVLTKAFSPSILEKGKQVVRAGEGNRAEMIIGEFTGARVMVRSKNDVAVAGFRNLARSANAVSQLRYPVMSGRYVSAEDTRDAIVSAQNASDEIQRKSAQFAHSMGSMGLERGQLAHTAKMAGFSKNALIAALRDTNRRWTIDRADVTAIANRLRETGEQDVRERIEFIKAALKEIPPVIDVSNK